MWVEMCINTINQYTLDGIEHTFVFNTTWTPNVTKVKIVGHEGYPSLQGSRILEKLKILKQYKNKDIKNTVNTKSCKTISLKSFVANIRCKKVIILIKLSWPNKRMDKNG